MPSATATNKTSKTFTPPRLAVATVAVVATVAAFAGPVSASAQASGGLGCPTCYNHNEVMAITAAE